MKAKKQHRKNAIYISLQVKDVSYGDLAEVYLGKRGRKMPLDMLPFDGDKIPQTMMEAC